MVKGLEGEADHDGDGKITVDELYDYAYEQIVSRTPKQTPGKWSYKQQGEIVLRQNIPIEDTRPIPLPDELIEAMNNSLPFFREGAVRQLEALLFSRNLGLSRSARAALEKMAKEDDSRSVSQTAADILARYQSKQAATKVEGEEEKLAQGEEEREVVEKIEKERTQPEDVEQAAPEEARWETAERDIDQKEKLEPLDHEEEKHKEKTVAEKISQENAVSGLPEFEKGNVSTIRPLKPISTPEEIKSTRPRSFPEEIKPHGKPKDLPQ